MLLFQQVICAKCLKAWPDAERLCCCGVACSKEKATLPAFHRPTACFARYHKVRVMLVLPQGGQILARNMVQDQQPVSQTACILRP